MSNKQADAKEIGDEADSSMEEGATGGLPPGNRSATFTEKATKQNQANVLTDSKEITRHTTDARGASPCNTDVCDSSKKQTNQFFSKSQSASADNEPRQLARQPPECIQPTAKPNQESDLAGISKRSDVLPGLSSSLITVGLINSVDYNSHPESRVLGLPKHVPPDPDIGQTQVYKNQPTLHDSYLSLPQTGQHAPDETEHHSDKEFENISPREEDDGSRSPAGNELEHAATGDPDDPDDPDDINSTNNDQPDQQLKFIFDQRVTIRINCSGGTTTKSFDPLSSDDPQPSEIEQDSPEPLPSSQAEPAHSSSESLVSSGSSSMTETDIIQTGTTRSSPTDITVPRYSPQSLPQTTNSAMPQESPNTAQNAEQDRSLPNTAEAAGTQCMAVQQTSQRATMYQRDSGVASSSLAQPCGLTPSDSQTGWVDQTTPETERVDQTTLETERVDQTTLETERVDQTTLETERVDQTTPEAERVDQTTPEAERVDQKTPETERVDQTTPEAERVDQTTPEAERVDQKTPETERVDQTTPETERVDQTTPEAERVDQTTLETERVDQTTPETERVDQTTPETERVDQTTLETERVDQTTPETERVDQTTPETERVDQTTLETERVDQTTPEIERVDQTTPETERVDQTTPETERVDQTTPETERVDQRLSQIGGVDQRRLQIGGVDQRLSQIRGVNLRRICPLRTLHRPGCHPLTDPGHGPDHPECGAMDLQEQAWDMGEARDLPSDTTTDISLSNDTVPREATMNDLWDRRQQLQAHGVPADMLEVIEYRVTFRRVAVSLLMANVGRQIMSSPSRPNTPCWFCHRRAPCVIFFECLHCILCRECMTEHGPLCCLLQHCGRRIVLFLFF